MGKPLRVLIIEDSEDDTLLLIRELTRGGYEVEFERVETAAAMQLALNQKNWDLILSDYSMPQFNAPQALEVLKASGLDLPFIISSGTIGEEAAVVALKTGASDFLVKGNFARLGPAIERELREAESRRERRRAEEALRESEEKFSKAFHSNPAMLAIATLDGKYVDVNQAYADFLGYPREEILGKNVVDLEMISVEEREKILRLIQRGGGSLHSAEVAVQVRDGSLRHILLSLDVISLGRVPHRLTTLLDITERKRAEEQTQLQLQHLKALRAIDIAISSSFDLNLTLDILLDQVVAQLNTDAAAVLLFQPLTRILEYAASRGFRSTAIRESRVRLGEGYAGKAILERRIIHIPNLMEADSEFANALQIKDEGFVDYYCVPLIVKGEVKGVLEIFHRSTLSAGPEWLGFLETLAGQAAIAIENANLFENLQHSNSELFQAYDATIEGWSHALDLRDKETEGHSLRVTELTLELARKFGFTDDQLRYMRWGALLHDIGKMGIPDNILLKPDELTDEEWESMKKHPVFAFEMLLPITYLKSSLDIPYSHHEKWDGTGYPRGLKGEMIPIAARLFAVVDVWDALRSDRPYRKAWTMEKTLEHIKSLSGIHFDPKVVEYFLEMIGRPNG